MRVKAGFDFRPSMVPCNDTQEFMLPATEMLHAQVLCLGVPLQFKTL